MQACDALVTHGTLGFPVTEYDPGQQPLVRFFFRRGVNGEVYGALPPGLPVASAPLCATARWLFGPAVAGATVRAERIGSHRPGDLARLRADPEAFAAGLVNPVACAAVVLLFFLAGLDAGADPRWAATAALGLGLGTFLWSYAESYWTEPLCLLALLGGFLALRRDAEGPGAPALGILGGALLGAAALFRYEASAIGAVLLAVAAVRLVRRRGPRALPGPVAGWGAGIAALAGWNWHRFGSVLVTGNPHGSVRDLFGVHVLGRLAFSLPANLVSPNQGLLVFAPPVAVALWIAVRAWRRCSPSRSCRCCDTAAAPRAGGSWARRSSAPPSRSPGCSRCSPTPPSCG